MLEKGRDLSACVAESCVPVQLSPGCQIRCKPQGCAQKGGKSGEKCASLFSDVHAIASAILPGEKILKKMVCFSTTVVELS